MWNVSWCDAMSVAVDALDEDHKVALTMMATVRRHIVARDGAAAGRELHRLIAHDRQHFAREERMLTECGFPGLAGHCDGHRRSEAQLVALDAGILAGDWPRVERLFEETCTGFIGLIAADIEYKWFLIDRGVTPRFAGTRVAAWEPRLPPSSPASALALGVC